MESITRSQTKHVGQSEEMLGNISSYRALHSPLFEKQAVYFRWKIISLYFSGIWYASFPLFDVNKGIALRRLSGFPCV